MRRRPPPRTVVGAVACVATLGLLTALGGCAAPVEVAAPTKGPAECRSLVGRLPKSVAGQERREVSPPNALAGAWGDPAIVLRCGVPRPATFRPSSPCAEVDHVGWFPEQRKDVYRFTTIGRSAYVQVEVPYDYQPAANALVDVSAAVRQSVPEQESCV